MDANKNGRITWEMGEGGLPQAEMHMQLMLKGEGSYSRQSTARRRG